MTVTTRLVVLSRSALVAAVFTTVTLATFMPLLAPERAMAQPQKDRAGVLERFDAGQKLFDQKQFDDALVVFRKVYADTDSPNARLMVARCYLALGQTAAGYDELSATVREAARKAQTEPKYARTRDAAAAELAALEPRVGKVIVAVVDESSSAPSASVGLTVSLTTQTTRGAAGAGAVLPAEKIGVPLAVLPGAVVVVATRADGQFVKREERVLAGETKTITLVLGKPTVASSPAVGPVATPPAIEVAPAPVARTGGQVRSAGFVTAAVGVAGFAVFGATFAVAQNDYNSVKSTCGNARCTDPKVESTIDSGKSFQLASNVALPVASVLTLAGVGMIVFGGPRASTLPTTGRGTAPRLSMSVRPGGLGAMLAF